MPLDEFKQFVIGTLANPAKAVITKIVAYDSSKDVTYDVYPGGQNAICTKGPYLRVNIQIQNQGETADYLWWQLKSVDPAGGGETVIANGLTGVISIGGSFPPTGVYSAINNYNFLGDLTLKLEVGHGSIVGAGGLDSSLSMPIRTSLETPNWVTPVAIVVGLVLTVFIGWKVLKG